MESEVSAVQLKQPDTCTSFFEALTQADIELRSNDFGATMRLQVMSSVVSLLSILGAFLIVLSFFLFKDVRTKWRVARLHVSLANFGVGVSILAASFFYFDLQLEKADGIMSPTVSQTCVVYEGPGGQAMLTAYGVLAALFWTLTLATYALLLMRDGSSRSWLGKLAKLVFGVCWAFPLLVQLWLVRAYGVGGSGHGSDSCITEASVDWFMVPFPSHLYAILTVVGILVTCTARMCYLLIKASSLTVKNVRIGLLIIVLSQLSKVTGTRQKRLDDQEFAYQGYLQMYVFNKEKANC